ncbi:glypican-1 isoform X2 [Ambystoma mexicanum]|uniref:glypican-1 isoform X2 n=1 Tax=Ambystoma mexicanum TaxID=8296 RepID=UPI0037E8AEF5
MESTAFTYLRHLTLRVSHTVHRGPAQRASLVLHITFEDTVYAQSRPAPLRESGEHLRVCPQGYTCCTSEMEENFANSSKNEFEAKLKEASQSVQGVFAVQHKNFDGYFQDLLNKSEKSLHDTFPDLYGDLYSQHVKQFRELYVELRQYYKGTTVNLEEVLHEFWMHLLERLFKLLNSQYVITDEYLDCVFKLSEQLKPFGEVPRDLKLKVTRALIASRSFVLGLGVGIEVVKRVSQVSLNQDCTRAIMKLVYCPHCRGMGGAKPCLNYCRNVMKGCLANQADLDTEWRNLVDSMLLVVDRFESPSNIEITMTTIHERISEAISIMQENKKTITNKVFQNCGNLKASTEVVGGEEKRQRRKSNMEEKAVGPALEKLVANAKGKLKDLKDYWVILPNALCNEKVTAASTNEDKCWNGMARGRYLPELMGDGLASQINNPEVDVDITKPDMTIRQQIMQLKIMTNRLRNAYNGNDVDYQDTSDDFSGSGSGGGCLDDLCGRKLEKSTVKKQSDSRTVQKKAGQGVPGASSVFRPSIFLLLLLLFTTAFTT